MPKKQKWFWLAALVAAWSFDFLFWKKPFPGIAFFIWVVILLGAGFLLSRLEGKKPNWRSILLSLLILAFSAVLGLREDMLVRNLAFMLAFGGMLLLAATFLDGYWPWYRIRDYIVECIKVIGWGFSGALLLASRRKNASAPEGEQVRGGWSRAWPILRGVLIALPIVAVFALLLSAADQVFADWLRNFFNLQKLPEYLFRLFYILIIAGVLVGVYLKAILPGTKALKPEPNQPWMKPFLGWTESGIILGAVNLLFIAFVIIQVRYLFGGTTNISETGYTYAEYARKGFGELVGVAVLSLGLYIVLSTITNAVSRFSRIGFTVLSVLLMANVMVILASSLQRLMLYEQAYGFSQLRTFTHVFIYWLAALIIAVVVLELLRRRGHFALALLVMVVGFGATVSLINIDGFIVERNVQRAQAGEKLDIAYLNSLSADAVPQLWKSFNDQGLSPDLRGKLGAALACRKATMVDPATRPWQAFNFSQARADWVITTERWPVEPGNPHLLNNEWFVSVDGEEIPCVSYSGMD